MWEVQRTLLNDGYCLIYVKAGKIRVSAVYEIDGLMYTTPYQSEAQELADKLNGVK